MNSKLSFNVLALFFSLTCLTFAKDLKLPIAGMNLSSINYYSSQNPFNNCILNSGEWISRDSTNDKWDDGRPVSIDKQGYPSSFLENQYVITLSFTHNDAHYPTGQYILTWEGAGDLKLHATDLDVVKRSKNRIVYNVPQATGLGLITIVKNIDSKDPIRNLALYLPNSEKDPSPFNPSFKANLKKFGVLRFMDWDQTNSSAKENWSDRTPKDYIHQGGRKGGAYEYMIALCNELQTDLWVCVPHKANVDYQKQLAQLIKETLDPKLRVWVEYSNEVWNPGRAFKQTKWLKNNQDVPGSNLPRKVAHKCAEVWNSFQTVFGEESDERLIRVGARQAGNTWAALEYFDELESLNKNNNNPNMPDVLAITHYFGGDAYKFILKNGYHLLKNPEEIKKAKEAIFQNIRDDINTKAGPSGSWTQFAALAKEKNLPLITYEGGPSVVARGKDIHDKELTQFLIEINRDPRMGECVKIALESWKKIGGQTPVNFADVTLYSRYGSWGFKEYVTQPLGDAETPGSAHKMRNLLEWINTQEKKSS